MLRVGTETGLEQVDRVWLFPPRQVAGGHSGLAVFALRDAHAAAQRTLATLRVESRAAPGDPDTRADFVRQGSVPADRVAAVVEGVVRRLGETEIPRFAEVRGSPERWRAVLDSIAPTAV